MISAASRCAFVVVAVIVFAACVVTREIPYESSPRVSKARDCEIEIFDAKDVPRPYKVIALVEANAGKFHSARDTVSNLKAKACELGADLIVDLESPGAGRSHAHLREVWTAKAAVWLQEYPETEETREE